jgi:hypothetical protein
MLDSVQRNMMDTLALKKSLTQVETKGKEARREMKRKNRLIRKMEYTMKMNGMQLGTPGDPPELVTLRNQASTYFHNYKEYQIMALNIIKKLEKNGMFCCFSCSVLTY